MQDGELDLERMVEHCGDRLLRTCALYLGDVHSAEDAVQDTFCLLYTSPSPRD